MKRCIICGNVGNDDSKVCPICGNPYLDLDDNIGDEQFDIQNQDEDLSVDMEEPADGTIFEEPEVEVDEISLDAEEEQTGEPYSDADAVPADDSAADGSDDAQEDLTEEAPKEAEQSSSAEGRRKAAAEKRGGKQQTSAQSNNQQPQRRRPQHHAGGPQIYGQADEQTADPAETGAFRRDINAQNAQQSENAAVQAAAQNARRRPANGRAGAQGAQRRPANAQAGAQGAQRRPANAQAGTQGGQRRPANAQTGAQGAQRRPANAQAGAQNTQKRSAAPAGGQSLYEQSGTAVIRQKSRKMMHSPLFVLLTIFQTIGLAGSVAAIFMKQLNFSQIMRLLTSIPLSSQITGYSSQLLKLMQKLDTDAVAFNLVLLIPDLLLCLGLWAMLFASLTKKREMSGAGFTLIKIDVIISLIKNGIVMIAGLVITVALVVSAWVSRDRTMITAAVITLVIMIVATMLVIMFSFSFLATLNTFRSNAVYGEKYGKASAYVAVVHILAGLISCIGLLSGIVNSEIAGIAEYAGKVLWMFLFAFWIFRYRARMSSDETEDDEEDFE